MGITTNTVTPERYVPMRWTLPVCRYRSPHNPEETAEKRRRKPEKSGRNEESRRTRKKGNAYGNSSSERTVSSELAGYAREGPTGDQGRTWMEETEKSALWGYCSTG